jgi:HEAT repeat protein
LDPAALVACTPRLVAALQTGNLQAQALACQLLHMLPPNALAPHAPALARHLASNTDREAGEALVSMLTKLDLSADPDVRPALRAALESDRSRVRENALEVLEKQSAEALAAHVPALFRCLLTIWGSKPDDDDDDDDMIPLLEAVQSLFKRVDPWELAKHTDLFIKALCDIGTDVYVRELAMDVVCLLPAAALAPHAQLLLQALRQPDGGEHCSAWGMRFRAAEALLKLELPLLSAMMPEVLAAAADGGVCDGATNFLSQLPPAMLAQHIPAVLRALVYRSCASEEEGMKVLRRVDPCTLAAHTAAMREPLRHNDIDVRRNALTLLGAFPSHPIAEHAEDVRTLLLDSDPLVSKLAAEVLAKLPTKGLADELSTLLERPEYAGHRAGWLPVLATLSGSAAPSPAVLRLLHDADPAVRASAVATLARLDQSALQEHVGLLLTALGDSDAKVRKAAMEAFIHLPVAALAEHVLQCLPRLKDPAWEVREAARQALGKVDKLALAAHTEPLLGMLPDGSLTISWDVWGVIELLPPAALAPHLVWLIDMLCKTGIGFLPDVQHNVQKVVALMPPNDVALAVGIELHQASLRKKIALDSVFIHLPPATLSPHAPLLLILTRDDDPRVKLIAFDTLSQLEPAELAKYPPALLTLGLQDLEPAVRCTAIGAVGRLPPDVLAPEAARVLRMLWDPDSCVREVAMQQAEEMRIQFGASPPLKEELRRVAVEACTAARDALAAGLLS